jgi:hypothetical protein
MTSETPSPGAEAFERIKSAIHAELRALDPVNALDFLDLCGGEIELLEEDGGDYDPDETNLELREGDPAELLTPALACESRD